MGRKSFAAGAGFTLVELLLAMSLMSMLLALAYGGLRASTRATDKGQAVLQDSGRIRMAHQFVRKQLNQMMPLVFAEGDSLDESIAFEGDARRIRYVAPMPGYLGFGGPQVQELALVFGDDGYELVLSHALLQGFEEQDLYQREPIVLLDQIESAQFSFLGTDERGELSGWATQWADSSYLPEAVSLEVEFSEDVYLQWPLLIASVRVDPSALDDLAGNRPNYGTSIKDLIERRGEQE